MWIKADSMKNSGGAAYSPENTVIRIINYNLLQWTKKINWCRTGWRQAEREGQETERYKPAYLFHFSEVRYINISDLWGFCVEGVWVCVLTSLQLWPQLSSSALNQEGPAVSGSPQLLPGCNKHTTSIDIWTLPWWGACVTNLGSKGQILRYAGSHYAVYPEKTSWIGQHMPQEHFNNKINKMRAP